MKVRPRDKSTSSKKRGSREVLKKFVIEKDGRLYEKDAGAGEGGSGRIFIRDMAVDISSARSINYVNSKFVKALKMLKRQSSQHDGILQLMDIDRALSCTSSSDDNVDQIALHQVVSKQLGACFQMKAQYNQAIEHFTKSNELYRCLRNRATDQPFASVMDLEICETMLSICQCQFKLKHYSKVQQSAHEIMS